MANNDGFYTAMVDTDGDIYEISGYQKGRKIGVDIRREQELLQDCADFQETLESWRPLMIKHGYITVPKTPEEIAQEAAKEQMRIMQERDAQQAEVNQALLESIQKSNETISTLKSIVEEMATNGYIQDNLWRDEQREDSPAITRQSSEKPAITIKNNRKATGANKISNSAGSKNSA